MTDRILLRPEVLSRTGLSRSGLYQRMAEGTFPRARRTPGEHGVWWIESEVAAWIADRIARSVVAGSVVGTESARKKKAA